MRYRTTVSGLLLRLLPLLLVLVICGEAPAVGTNDGASKYEHWITGDVITSGGQLLFYTNNPVQGDTSRSLVLLATPASLAEGFIPLYRAAAQRKVPLRLYGVLTHTDLQEFPGAPAITFTAWKIHGANDPDELPPDQVVYVKPQHSEAEGARLPSKDVFTKPQRYSFGLGKDSVSTSTH